MTFFTRKELKGLGVIFGILTLLLVPNFIFSLRRARDAQRKADIGSIYSALIKYHEDFGFYPLSSGGLIAACSPFSISEAKVVTYSGCKYGLDSLRDLSDENYPLYLKTIPDDPSSGFGRSYYYFSNGNHFQIYGALEGKNEDEYDLRIVGRQIKCGNTYCNFGKSDNKTPLDKSIEEYENELMLKNEKK